MEGRFDHTRSCAVSVEQVIMLRRLDERNKRRALRVVCGGGALGYDALYGKPHDAGDKPPWPGRTQVEALRRLGYCPSLFTLYPGDYVHINKGRLHAFRKQVRVCVSE